jgi:hypothetical protein
MTAIASDLRFFGSSFLAKLAAVFVPGGGNANAGKVCTLVRLLFCHDCLPALRLAQRNFIFILIFILASRGAPDNRVVAVGAEYERRIGDYTNRQSATGNSSRSMETAILVGPSFLSGLMIPAPNVF